MSQIAVFDPEVVGVAAAAAVDPITLSPDSVDIFVVNCGYYYVNGCPSSDPTWPHYLDCPVHCHHDDCDDWSSRCDYLNHDALPNDA